jgi:lambda repressor-like predicted transcriptional regulator
MEFSKKQAKARAVLARLRDKGVKWRDISMMSGVSIGYLSGICDGYRQFSDNIADKIIAGCKGAK